MAQYGFREMPLAIIGMGCRLPGADNLEQYWRLLRDGVSALAEFPPHRLDLELYYHPDRGVLGKTYTKRGGVVPDRPFDRGLCPVSEDLIASSDISHLSMLEIAAAACHHAGLDPLALPLRNTGVFIGQAHGNLLRGEMNYATHIEEVAQFLHRIDAFAQLSSDLRDAVIRDVVDRVRREKPHRGDGGKPDVVPNAVAGLISEAFGLTGPYMAIDAACASSLFALASAAQALHHGHIDMAIVGGGSYSTWQKLVLFSQAQALSATGSYPFDARADGFIYADGYAAVLVKALPRALADGDAIHGIIRGIGVSCDGRGRSLWAPRKEGQIEAIRRAYADGLDAARLQYIEAHSASTRLGDAIEAHALATALGECFPRGTKIPISSVKANIGHTVETAGVASLIKTLLAMQHGIVPPAANYETPNPEIDWNTVPFFVPTSEMEWPAQTDGHPRRAAVNSFGIGGLNVHVVLDQPPSETGTPVFMPERPSLHQGDGVKSDSDKDAVAIIGLGGIFPDAHTLAAYWDLLVSGRDPKSKVPTDRWDADIFYKAGSNGPWHSPTELGGFITDFVYDWKKHKIPPKQLETGDPLQFMLLDAADQALIDAGYDRRPFDHRRVSVIVGTIFGGDFNVHLNLALHLPEFERQLRQVLRRHEVSEAQTQEMLETFREAFIEHKPMIRDKTGSYSSSTLASRVAKTFDLMGGAFALDAGEASSFAALSTSVDFLLSGTCDMVLCAGAQRSMDVSTHEEMALRGLLTPDTPRAAFDADANGLVLGEGVGMLLLKRLSDAQRDGDPIRAVIRGIGGATHTESSGDAMRGAIERALLRSGIKAEKIGAIETAGTGVAAIDAEETGALMATYGSEPRQHPLLVGSVIGQIGHTQAASGMASLLKMTLSLQNRELPASFGLVNPGQSVVGHSTVLRPALETAPVGADGKEGRCLAGVSTLAFRGLAYHVILERGSAFPAFTAIGGEDWRILRIGAATMAELAERVARSRDDAESLYAGAEISRYTTWDRARLAIVANSPGALAKKLRLASERMAHPGARPVLEEQGIFYRERAEEPPRVALLFPGQGSQYTGMLRNLTREVPAAAAMLNQIDETMTRLGYPTFTEIAWGPDTGLGIDVWRTQVSMLLADTIVYTALDAMGIRPDVISAHSYGEFPALIAAGAWTLEQAIRATRARCDLIEATEGADGAMLSTTAPAELVERFADEINGAVHVANYNAPDQTVVAGDKEAVAEIDSRLTSAGFENRLLPVPRPYHTPLMAHVPESLLHQIFEVERILPPRTPLLSSVTNCYVADPLDIRNNLVRQLTQPLRYVDLIERLARDGVTVFVEVGPRQVLTRLHRRILANRDAVIIASDNPSRPGIEQLLRVQAALECAGASVGVTKIDEQRQSQLAIGTAQRARGDRIIHFDATLRRKEKLRGLKASSPSMTLQRPSESGLDTSDELSVFLIHFVCEQTGYPPEVVDLEADLEADLGIDSIKKAQLFGELREKYNIRMEFTQDFSLNDFTTLRHVLEFLKQAGISADSLEGPTKPPTEEVDRVVATPVDDKVKGEVPEATPSLNGLCIVGCAGTPYDMGVEHARSQQDQIRSILEKYCTLVGLDLDNVPETVQALHEIMPKPWAEYFSPAALEELRGMADVLGMPVEYVAGLNLGLYPEYIGGCAQFAITAHRNGPSGMIHGANEDWPLSLHLPDCLTRIVQVCHPAGGIPLILFSVPGQVGGLNGINARGLVVTSSMLLDRQWRSATTIGTIHSIIVKTVLERAVDIESAVEIVRSFKRTSAWSLCISHHQTDQVCYLEYDGSSLAVQLNRDVVMATNHCFLHSPFSDVPEHSNYRLTRLRALLDGDGQAGFTLEEAQSALRDRYDLGRQRETAHLTMNTIQRADNQISIVVRPALGEVWITPGPLVKEKVDHYYQLRVKELLRLDAWPTHPVDQRVEVVPSGQGPEIALEEEDVEVPPDKDGCIMSRFVLRMVDAPLNDENGRMPRFHGPVLILGENPTARALRGRLDKLGVTVLNLQAGDDHEESLAAFNRLWEAHPIPHLFLLTARDEERTFRLEEDAWRQRRDYGVLLPYLVCQQWARLISRSGLIEKATLVAATAMGGDFGFSGRVTAVEGGGLTGLLKSIRREFDGMVVKVIDTPPEEPAQWVVDAICAELTAATPQVEVGYVRRQRRVVQAVPRPMAPVEPREIRRGGTWVVTGGARGITAFVARKLGRRFDLNVQLIGTSPVPQIDGCWRDLSEADRKALKMRIAQEARGTGRDPSAAWREVEKAIEIDKTLRAFAEEGVRVAYHSCDVSDREALATVLDRIRQSAGPICGVIHGAGVEVAARFDRKQLEGVRATIAAKVDGAAAIMALTREDPLEYFVGFGSVSGRFGGLGQTDYSLASDMLCKMIQRFRTERPKCASVGIHWPAWDGAGMAMRPESKLALEISGQRFMPPPEGVEHLVDELCAGAPEGEVLVIDRPGKLDLDGIMPTASRRRAYLRRRKAVANSPLIEGIRELDEGHGLLAEVRFYPAVDPFLLEHQIQGIPLLPAVIGIETLAEAASILGCGQVISGLHDIEIVNGLRFYSDRPQDARVRVVRTETGAECELSGEFYDRHGRLIDPHRIYIAGTVDFDKIPVPIMHSMHDERPQDWNEMQYLDDRRAREKGLVLHGPRFRCLRQVWMQSDGGWGRIIAPPLSELGEKRGNGWIIPAAVLDACLVACGVFANTELKVNQLPLAFKRLRIDRLPRAGEHCTVRLNLRGRQDDSTYFDFALFGNDGTVILVAEGHRCVILSNK